MCYSPTSCSRNGSQLKVSSDLAKRCVLSATPLVLSLSWPDTSRHSLTAAMATPMCWDFSPLFYIFAPLSRASLSPRTVDCCPSTETNMRIVRSQNRRTHQSSHCWVAASVRIEELGFCIGRLFKCVIVLCVKTTPQMTRFRDAKVCIILVTDEIDDHRNTV